MCFCIIATPFKKWSSVKYIKTGLKKWSSVKYIKTGWKHDILLTQLWKLQKKIKEINKMLLSANHVLTHLPTFPSWLSCSLPKRLFIEKALSHVVSIDTLLCFGQHPFILEKSNSLFFRPWQILNIHFNFHRRNYSLSLHLSNLINFIYCQRNQLYSDQEL